MPRRSTPREFHIRVEVPTWNIMGRRCIRVACKRRPLCPLRHRSAAAAGIHSSAFSTIATKYQRAQCTGAARLLGRAVWPW
jgi:hypothetical protein